MFGIYNKLNKKEKATQAIPTTAFPGVSAANEPTGTGLVQPTTALVAGDRGCFPEFGDVAATQAADAQLVLEEGGVVEDTGISTDLVKVVRLLCTTSGTCCTTDLCNSMSRIEMSFVAMFMSIALALIGVFKGF